MFVRYLGGGIGHLEQFPPAHDDQDIMDYDHGEELEVDDSIVPGNGGGSEGENDGKEKEDGTGGGDEDSEDGEGDEGDEKDQDDGDNEDEEVGEDDDMEDDDFDEEAGNVY